MKIAKRSLAQCVHYPSVDGGSIAMASPAGFGLDGRAATCTEVRNSNPSGVRESNRVSNWLFRMVAILAVLLNGSMAKSQDLVFDGITPAPGSEISSFDFVLKFDLSKIIENNGQGEYGVGWVGYHNDKRPTDEESITIYKGEPADKIVIGRCCDDYYNGGDADFIPSSEVKISIPGAIPEPGVKYTMVISNEFEVYTKKNGAKPYPNSLIDYFTEPLIYTFVGTAVSTEKLNVASCSVSANQSLDTLTEVTFTFSQPVSINSAKPLVLKENDLIFATSVNAVLSEDKTTVIYKFDKVSLLLNHTYVISLPEGAVSSAIQSSDTNVAFNIPISGTSVGHFLLSSSIPASGQKTIFSTIEGIFDMPEGFNIYVKPPYTLNLYGYLYKDEVSEENLVGRLNGEVNSAKNGITWTNTYALEPETSYILNKPAGEFRAYELATDKTSNDWFNGEVRIMLNTPSIQESGITPLVFSNPTIGEHGKDNDTLESGQKISYLGNIEIPLNDIIYYYEGQRQILAFTNSLPSTDMYIYDVTDGTNNLVKTCNVVTQTRETTTSYYTVLKAPINCYFFSGHKYKLVLPKGAVTVATQLIRNYAANKEWSLEFEGDAPANVNVTDCSLTDKAQLSELASVIWKFKGEFTLAPELSIQLLTQVPMPTGTMSGYITNALTAVKAQTGETTLVAAFYDPKGGPLQLNPKYGYQIIVPEGLIFYAGDPSIKNEKMTLDIVPIAPTNPDPEFVNVNIVTNDFMTTTQKAVKGKPFSYAMNFKSIDENVAPWEVKSVTIDGKNVNNVNGTYTTLALTADTELAVEVEYTGNWAVEVSTGVWEIQDSNIQIFKENDHIVVSGVTPDKTIAVYNVAGMLVNTTRSEEGKDIVRISAAPGQIYIVIVDGKAAKIQL